MKKFILLCSTFLFSFFINAQTSSFCDDFEGYQVGDLIAEIAPEWNSWAELMNGATAPFVDDVNVTDGNASSGTNSLFFEGIGTGGPADIVLPFGTGAPYTSGDFEFSANFFVNSGTGAYFNFQAETTPGIEWSLDVQMDAFGGISFENGGGATVFLTSTYPMNTWFEIKLVVNLTTNNWEVFIDNQSQGSFSNTVNKIASLDLYPIGGHQFYVDDVCYSYTPFNPLTHDMSGIDISTPSNVGLSAAPFIISGKILSLSSSTINSADINYSINGGAPVVDNLTGLNISLLDTLSFNHSVTWTPPLTGAYVIDVWASNLNGNVDQDQTNDTITETIYVWNALAVRRPLIETFTSSTCGPCAPANVTAEALFAQNPGNHTSIKYQADWPGTGDPYYTEEVGDRIAYYAINSVPRMEIDGGWDQNGNNITQQVLDEHIEAASFVNITSSYDINVKTIDVDITIDPLEDIQSNNLVVHTAIIEETTYNNVKTNGETQFEHVVKKMVPNVLGTPINSLVAGQQVPLNLSYTFNGEYRLPWNANDPIIHATEHSIEDFQNLMVAVWVQDALTKEVYQSTMSTLGTYTAISYNCVNNSCVDPLDGTGQYSDLLSCQAACGATTVKEDNKNQLIFPNPATEKIYFSNLKEQQMLIRIYDLQGREVLKETILNNESLKVSFLSKGIYQLSIEGVDSKETRKLIIE